MEFFKDLISSEIDDREVFVKMMERDVLKTKMKYCNDSDVPFAIFVGAIGEDDLVTVNNNLCSLKMKFDVKSIYLDFIKKVRELYIDSDKEFDDVVLQAVKTISLGWFKIKDTSEAVENAKLAQKHIDFYNGNSDIARDSYASEVGVVNEKKMELVYNLSKFKGTGDLAKCVEVNSVACNLLAFSGYDTVLAQGYYVDYKGNKFAHTFPFYKKKEGDYCLLDCSLKRIE